MFVHLLFDGIDRQPVLDECKQLRNNTRVISLQKLLFSVPCDPRVSGRMRDLLVPLRICQVGFFPMVVFVYDPFAQEWEIAVSLLGAGGAVFVVGAICLCCRRRLHKQGIADRKATSRVEAGGECPTPPLTPADDHV